MKFYRYGKIRFQDFIPFWIMAIGLITIPFMWVYGSFQWDFLLIFPFLVFLFAEISFVQMATERFTLKDHRIIVEKMGQRLEIAVPEDAVFVISHADWIPPIWLDMGFIANNITTLKGKLSVSILCYIPSKALAHYFEKTQRCTNTMLETEFPKEFLYNVVISPVVMARLTDWNCYFIVPDYLQNDVSLPSSLVLIQNTTNAGKGIDLNHHRT